MVSAIDTGNAALQLYSAKHSQIDRLPIRKLSAETKQQRSFADVHSICYILMARCGGLVCWGYSQVTKECWASYLRRLLACWRQARPYRTTVKLHYLPSDTCRAPATLH